ncbi:hypothetical protein Deima_2084 [Deinococcus maricopensis DSM 21211]|uniref:Uncharacterized protein n=1 Tax=Deinococcus maricopensis (strain DSM 21211 / LMG 22137 / NRRL B-23946 / LB-34) TaxID=709986 RepID=E8U9I8_DEIML|nr:hypothetical protein Deima_2084 [Deinococcus maricopensis DSM 21211]
MLRGVLRAVYVLSGLLYLPVGVLLMFLPTDWAAMLGVQPLWLPRVAGAVLSAWGVQLLFGAVGAERASRIGLALANLLVAATILPAALRATDAPVRLSLLILGGYVLILGLLAVGLRRPRRGLYD